jgi:hypothetical protein
MLLIAALLTLLVYLSSRSTKKNIVAFYEILAIYITGDAASAQFTEEGMRSPVWQEFVLGPNDMCINE